MALKLFELEAVVGLDDSAYRNAIQNVQSETKKVVASLSSEYSKAAKSVAELTQKYNNSVSTTGKTSKETKELKTQLAAAQAQLKATTSALKSANTNMSEFASSTQKASGESLTGALTKANLLTSALTKLGSAALSAAKQFVQSGIDYNAQIESYTVGFTNMLGSAEAAQQAMAAIQEDAAKTPFNVEALTQANQLLISAGENAGYSRKVIMALGNAVNAAGGGNAELSRMAANLQQIANVGKAASIDIKQFAYAGINIYQVLADYTGKSVQEVQNMTISYDTLSQALIAASEEGGRYYGAMDTQSQTMNGRVSTLQDNVKQLAGLMTGDLSDGIGIVISNLNDLVVNAQEAYKTDGWIGLAGAITGLSDPISSAKDEFDDFASSAVTWLDQLSYKLNRFLGKAATADFDTYEEYATDQQKQRNRDRLRQNALKGIGISNKSWSERQAELAAANGDGGSSITSNGTGGTTQKNKSTGSKTETVIASVSSTVSTTAQNALGNVTTSITTLQEKVKDASGNIKDRVTTTTTETGKEMVNGVETTYKTIETKVDGHVTKTVKTYDDMSKVLTETATKTATKTVQGVTTAINEVTEKYADGSEHIKTTETKTEEVIVNGVAQTVKAITTYIDGIPDKVQTTTEEVERTVLASQNRIDQYTSELGQEMSKGIFGLTRSLISNLQSKNWSGVAQNVAKLIFGQVDQNQRETIARWAKDAAAAINEKYAGGGVQAGLQAIADLFQNGITPAANESTKAVQSFASVMKGLSSSGGTGNVVSGLLKLFGGGSAGSAAAGEAATGEAIASAATGATSFFPEALAILAAIAGGVMSFKLGQSDRAKADAGEEKSLASKVASGALVLGMGPIGWIGYLLGKSKKSKSSSESIAAEPTSSALDYTDIQDAYWYGNERAFAGYDFRTDPYTYNPHNSLVNQYQEKMQTQLAALTSVVEQYLPEVANTQLVLDDGTLVGSLATGMNDQLGHLQLLAERGN